MIDLVLLVIFFMIGIFGCSKGLLKTLSSIALTLLSYVVANKTYERFDGLKTFISNIMSTALPDSTVMLTDRLSQILCFLVVFVVCYIFIKMASVVVAKLLAKFNILKTTIIPLDRLLGACASVLFCITVVFSLSPILAGVVDVSSSKILQNQTLMDFAKTILSALVGY